MEQGTNTFENTPLPVSPSELDYVLSHAHIDHTGNLPLLFGGRDLRAISWQQKPPATSAVSCFWIPPILGIRGGMAEQEGERQGREPFVPVYTTEDAQKILQRFREFDLR